MMCICLSLMTCSYIYKYLFDTTLPNIAFSGIDSDTYHAGDIACTLSSSKNGELSVWIDNQPLIDKLKIGSSKYVHEFNIPTKTIANDKHILKLSFTDSTYHKNTATLEKIFFVDNTPIQASFLRPESDYKVFQGRTLHLQFQVNKPIKEAKINTLSNSYRCFPESKNSLTYECFIPIACEESPNEYLLSLDITDYTNKTLHLDNKFQVISYQFKKQAITLSAEKIKQEEELGLENQRFEEIINQITMQSPQEKLWRSSFCTPIDIIRTTCDFGTIRTTQHKGRYAHKAVDIINDPKSVVWSSNDGIVVFKDRFAGNGNTVIVDHGCGVLSIYCHLDSFSKINIGDKVAKGNPIGTIGKTGYATGYHLHWELRVGSVPVDPMQWTKPIF